jgi:ABC-type uncharacterized transport system substrate-binding protein
MEKTGVPIDSYTYASLIKGCLKIKSYDTCHFFIKNVQEQNIPLIPSLSTAVLEGTLALIFTSQISF